MKLYLFKAVSPVTLAVNCLRSIFHGFVLVFPVHHCSRTPLFHNTFLSVFSHFYLYPLLEPLHLLIKAFSSKRMMIDYIADFIAEHTQTK